MGDLHNLKFEEPINEFCPSTQLNFHKFLEAAGLDSMLIKNGRRISDSEVLAEFSHGFAILPADPNLRGKKVEYTALMEAAIAGHTEIARLLLQYGASVTQTANNENTALHNAATAGHLDCVKLLLEYGSSLELQNETGHTPLMEATSNGHIDVARCLIEHGANINSHSTEFKESALTLASYKGHNEMVQFLLEAGADHEHRTDEMHTALMEAAMEGHIEVARLLLAHGANVNIPQDSFESPLTLAACGGHTELALLLLGYEADIEEVNDEGYTPLMEASREGHEETVALLLAYGADVNAKTEETQETALTLAACGGFIEVCEMLLNAGADLEVGGMECSTPLMEAAQEGHLNLVHRLLERDADVNAQTATGDTALHYSAENGHYKVCKELLEWGASYSPMAEGGRTPLMKAARAGHLEVVQLLVQWGVMIDQMTTQSDANALSLACNGGHVAVVEYLLMSGADPHIQLRDGSTMLIEASRSGNPSVLRLILDFPKSLNMSVIDGQIHQQLDVANRPPISVYESAIASFQQSHNQSTLTLQQQALAVTTSLPSSDFNVVSSTSPTSTNRLNAALANAFAAGWASGAAALVKNKKPIIRPNAQGVPEPFLLNEIAYPDVVNVEETNEYKSQPTVCDSFANGKSPASTTCVSSTSVKTTEKTCTASNYRPLSAADILSQFTDSNNDISAILNLFGELMPDLKGDHVELVKRFGALMDPKYPAKNGRGNNSTPVDFPVSPNDYHSDNRVENELIDQKDEENKDISDSSPKCNQSKSQHKKSTEEKPKSFKKNATNTNVENPKQKVLSSINSNLSFLKKFKRSSNMKIPTDKSLLKHYFESDTRSKKEDLKNIVEPIKSSVQSRPTRSCSSPSIPSVASGTIAGMSAPCSSSDMSISSTCNGSSISLCGETSYSSSARDSLRHSDASRATSADRVMKLAKKKHLSSRSKHMHPVNTMASHQSVPLVKSAISCANSLNIHQKSDGSSLSVRDENLKSFMEGFEYARHHIALTASNVQAQLPVAKPKNETIINDQGQDMMVSSSIPSPPSLLPCPTHETPNNSVLAFTPNGFLPTNQQGNLQIPDNSPVINNGGTSCIQEQSIDVNACIESSMESALTLACNGGFVELVRLLIERGADKEHRDKKSHTPLHTAVFANQRAIVTLLLDYGADIEAQLERTKDTALSIACSHGKLEIVEELLKRSANKEHRNISDYTPLSLAASGGFVDVIQTLLRHGAEINSRTGSKLGISPLMLAAMNGHTAAVKMLLDNGSDINAQIETNRNTALTLACFQGRHEVVSLLLERKANCEQRAKTGLTPLMEAASGDYVEVGKILLAHGAEVNASPVVTSRDTALTIAADKGNLKFVDLLLQKGALVDARNKKGATPLWLACNGGHQGVVQSLVKYNANVNSQDNRSVSCLMAAFRKGHVPVVKFLVQYVTQYPSEKDGSRHMKSIVNDEELLKRCQQCLDIIVLAKQKQEGEARKNADVLLEQIEQEEEERANKQAMQAKKREKKRLKKKAKQEKERQCKLVDGPNEDKKSDKNVEPKRTDVNDNNSNDPESDMEHNADLDDPLPVEQVSTSSVKEPNISAEKKKSIVHELIDSQVAAMNQASISKDKTTENKRDKHRNRKLNQRAAKRAEKQLMKPIHVETEIVNDSQESKSDSVCGTVDKEIYDLAVAESDEDQDWNAYIENKSAKYNQFGARSPNEGAWKVVRVQKNQANQGHNTSGHIEVIPDKKSFQSSAKKRLSIPVSKHDIGKVIGQAGSVVSALRAMSGIQIDIESARGDEVTERKVYLKGPGEVVNNVQEIIQNLLTGNVAGNDVLVRYANCRKAGRGCISTSLTVASLLNASGVAATATVPSNLLKQPIVAASVKKPNVVPLMNTCKISSKSGQTGQVFSFVNSGKQVHTPEKVNFAVVAASGVLPDSNVAISKRPSSSVTSISDNSLQNSSSLTAVSNSQCSLSNTDIPTETRESKAEVGIHDPSIFPPLTINGNETTNSLSSSASTRPSNQVSQSSNKAPVVSLTQPLMLDITNGQDTSRINSSLIETMSSGIPSGGTSSQTSTVYTMNTTPGTKSFARAPGSERSQHKTATSTNPLSLPVPSFRDSSDMSSEPIHGGDLLGVTSLSSIMTPTKRVSQSAVISQSNNMDYMQGDNGTNIDKDVLNDNWKQVSLLNGHNEDNHISQLNNNANSSSVDFSYEIGSIKHTSNASSIIGAPSNNNLRQQVFNSSNTIPTPSVHMTDLTNQSSFGHKSSFDFMYSNEHKAMMNCPHNGRLGNGSMNSNPSLSLSNRSYQQSQLPGGRLPPTSNSMFSQNMSNGLNDTSGNLASLFNNQSMPPNVVPSLFQQSHGQAPGNQMGLSHVNTQVPPPAFPGPSITMPPPNYESTIYGGIHSNSFSSQGSMLPPQPNPLLNHNAHHLATAQPSMTSASSLPNPPVPIGAERRRQTGGSVLTGDNSLVNGTHHNLAPMHQQSSQQNGHHMGMPVSTASNSANSFIMSLNNANSNTTITSASNTSGQHKKSQPSQWWPAGISSGMGGSNGTTGLIPPQSHHAQHAHHPANPHQGPPVPQQHLWSSSSQTSSTTAPQPNTPSNNNNNSAQQLLSRQTGGPPGTGQQPKWANTGSVLPPGMLHQLHSSSGLTTTGIPPPSLNDHAPHLHHHHHIPHQHPQSHHMQPPPHPSTAPTQSPFPSQAPPAPPASHHTSSRPTD